MAGRTRSTSAIPEDLHRRTLVALDKKKNAVVQWSDYKDCNLIERFYMVDLDESETGASKSKSKKMFFEKVAAKTVDTDQDWRACYERFKVKTQEYFELRQVLETEGFKWDKRQAYIIASDESRNALPNAEIAKKKWKGKPLRFYKWLETIGGRSTRMHGPNRIKFSMVEDCEISDTETVYTEDEGEEDDDILEDDELSFLEAEHSFLPQSAYNPDIADKSLNHDDAAVGSMGDDESLELDIEAYSAIQDGCDIQLVDPAWLGRRSGANGNGGGGMGSGLGGGSGGNGGRDDEEGDGGKKKRGNNAVDKGDDSSSDEESDDEDEDVNATPRASSRERRSAAPSAELGECTPTPKEKRAHKTPPLRNGSKEATNAILENAPPPSARQNSIRGANRPPLPDMALDTSAALRRESARKKSAPRPPTPRRPVNNTGKDEVLRVAARAYNQSSLQSPSRDGQRPMPPPSSSRGSNSDPRVGGRGARNGGFPPFVDDFLEGVDSLPGRAPQFEDHGGSGCGGKRAGKKDRAKPDTTGTQHPEPAGFRPAQSNAPVSASQPVRYIRPPPVPGGQQSYNNLMYYSQVKVETEESDDTETQPPRKKQGREVKSSTPLQGAHQSENEPPHDASPSPVFKRESPEYVNPRRDPEIIDLTSSPEVPRRQGAKEPTPVPDPGPHERGVPPVNSAAGSMGPSSEWRKHGRHEEDDGDMDDGDMFLHHALKRLRVDNRENFETIVASNDRATTYSQNLISNALYGGDRGVAAENAEVQETIQRSIASNNRAIASIRETVREGRVERRVFQQKAFGEVEERQRTHIAANQAMKKDEDEKYNASIALLIEPRKQEKQEEKQELAELRRRAIIVLADETLLSPTGHINLIKTFAMEKAVMEDYLSFMEAGLDHVIRREWMLELFEEYREFSKTENGKKCCQPLRGLMSNYFVTEREIEAK